MSNDTPHFRTCHLCEAMCGLQIELKQGAVRAIRGDKEDPLSKGHICPKATALADIHNDPDRLRRPMRRTKTGWQEVSWAEALDEVARQLVALPLAHGDRALAVYLGNPNAHNYGSLTHAPAFIQRLATRNRFSATSVDQLPHHLVSYLMFGHQFLLPVPDLDRTQLLVVFGANPLASNGSMMSAPGFKDRLKALRKRGGRLVVLDPRRTETAKAADLHHFIRPGTDALLLAALLFTLQEEGLIMPGRLTKILQGFGAVLARLEPFSPKVVALATGISERDIRLLARDLARTPKSVVYGRMGVSTQHFGSVCHWFIHLINIATGNFDQPGGAMFTRPAFDFIGGPNPKPGHYDRWRSRVRGLPEFAGELPVSVLAEEILTPGERIRGLVTLAGNPVLSTPNGTLLEEALAQLDFMVSIDCYLNETTRFADFILPPTSPLERDHYDTVFHALAVRNTAKYAPALFPKPEDSMSEWEILAALSARIDHLLDKPHKPLPPPHAILDAALAHGPYGRQSGHEQALDLAKLLASPHGIDLGPLQPCLPQRLATPDQKINCAPPVLMDDLDRLLGFLYQPLPPLMLIGRRTLHSNNSWMHQYSRLTKAGSPCVLLMHPFDSHLRNLHNGQEVTVTSRVGSVKINLAVTEDIMPGVVSIPHGYGHHRPGTQIRNAARVPGVSINDLTDHLCVDPVSGNSALNGVTVEVSD